MLNAGAAAGFGFCWVCKAAREHFEADCGVLASPACYRSVGIFVFDPRLVGLIPRCIFLHRANAVKPLKQWGEAATAGLKHPSEVGFVLCW